MPREGGGERRRERRVPCDFIFSVRCLAEPGGLASAIDLSTSGMRFLYVGSNLAPTEKILVQFTVRSSTWSFCGQLVRVSTPQPFTQEVAVVFQAVDERTRSLLGEAIRQGLDAAPAVAARHVERDGHVTTLPRRAPTPAGAPG